jgi:hypothetical protein
LQPHKTPCIRIKTSEATYRNIKNSIHGTYHATRAKHLPRYLAEFSHRFNRRFDLAALMPRLAVAAVRASRMPYRLAKRAESHW